MLKIYTATGVLLICLGVALGKSTTETTTDQKITALERQVKSLSATVESYHIGEQFRPPDDIAETWVRIRRALKACGCTFSD